MRKFLPPVLIHCCVRSAIAARPEFGSRASRLLFSTSMSSSISDTNPSVVATNVKAVVKPERRDELIKLLEYVQNECLEKEPGMLCYAWGHDLNDPNTFLFHEQYKTSSDYEHHRTTPHYNKLMKFTNTDEPLVSLDLQEFHCSHTPKIQPSLDPAFRLNVATFCKPEFREDFIKLMTSHQSSSLAEPGCIQFDWGQSVNDPNVFYIHEQYRTKADFEAHTQSAHFARFLKFNEQDPYTQPQAVNFFHTPIEKSTS